jgi:hypothetical protein
MNHERWQALMADFDAKLTPDELAAGWHFCAEWDGLLVGPGMDELQVCDCFDGLAKRRAVEQQQRAARAK